LPLLLHFLPPRQDVLLEMIVSIVLVI